ncbi:MAG: hypothetical protein M0P57_11735 [Syntrophales bacterium]|jgi:hypothetical protein|nr:hypothetical protein [Syntrophales bacterium]MDY0044311.1 hypothetical protein [Syntrophales bacterium]
MHYLQDTDEQDALTEKFWPDEFKQTIRNEVQNALTKKMKPKSLSCFYSRHYADKYKDLKHFTDEVNNKIVISAENGADDGFAIVYNAFLTESRLPEQRHYTQNYWPQVLTRPVKNRIRKEIIKSYEKDESFIYAYFDGYVEDHKNFMHFLDDVAGLIISGIEKGIDDRLEVLYKSFIIGRPLGIIRRNPKRLKTT